MLRRSTVLPLATALCASLVFLSAPADAKETSDSALKDAQSLAKGGPDKRLKAAQRFGDAVALAQAAGDLASEDAAAVALESFFTDAAAEALRNPDAEGKPDGPPSRSALLVAVMQKLDAGRCGAFVSAPVVARNVLETATETGVFDGVADAAKVAAAHASKRTSGQAAAVAAQYAKGLELVAAGKFDAAALPLDAAAVAAANAGWTDLATHAATEAAAAWLRAGAADKAAASMTSAVACFGETPDPMLVSRWGVMVAKRLADAPAEVKKPFETLRARLPTGNTSSGAGGAGGAGGKGGATDIGKLLAKWPKGKPFASATRTARQFEVRWATKPDDKQAAAFDEGVHFADEGGVWIAFCGRAVGLQIVDLVGGRGGPGGGATPPPVRAYYLLAEGETWNVSKDGVVTITR